MPTIAEVEKLALELPDAERAQLASNLLRSLPPVLLDNGDGTSELTEEEERLVNSLPGVLHADDEGYAEALRRDAEMDADPSMSITWAELKEFMRERLRSCR